MNQSEKYCGNCANQHLGKNDPPCDRCGITTSYDLWQPKHPTREPQCRTKAECLRRFADTMDMCEAEGIAPSYKYDGQIEIGPNSSFGGIPEKYEFMLAIVEGRPVFRGDVLYNQQGEECIASEARLSHSGLTWTPPKPATISVNGVEVKSPIELVCDEDAPQFERYWVSVTYKTKADAEAFKAAIEGGK